MTPARLHGLAAKISAGCFTWLAALLHPTNDAFADLLATGQFLASTSRYLLLVLLTFPATGRFDRSRWIDQMISVRLHLNPPSCGAPSAR